MRANSLLLQSLRGALLIFGILATSCESDYTPKPKGYLRIDLPEKNYLLSDLPCSFQFEHSDQAIILRNPKHKDNACWFDLVYPRFKASVHFTYHPLNANLFDFTEEMHTMAMKHVAKADEIDDRLIRNDSSTVYGISYDFHGSTASNYQFFVTDSTQHFVRGALYFNLPPNPDSIAPVMDFVKEDLYYLIESFRWKS